MVIVLGLISSTTFAQLSNYYSYDAYHFFDVPFKVKETDLFSVYGNQLGLTNNDVMVLERTDSLSADTTNVIDTGYVHDAYLQYHKGYMVENARMNVFSKFNVVLIANGFIVKNLNVNTTNPISESSALSTALSSSAFSGITQFAWQDTAAEDTLKTDPSDPNDTTYYPKGTLVITTPYGDTAINDTSKYHLCWKFLIWPIIPAVFNDSLGDSIVIQSNAQNTFGTPQIIYVDAINNTIVSSYPAIQSDFYVNGTVATQYDGSGRSIQTKTCTFCSNYNLTNEKTITGIDLKYNRFGAPYRIPLKNGSNSWAGTIPSAYWIASVSEDYFKSKFGWNGPNFPYKNTVNLEGDMANLLATHTNAAIIPDNNFDDEIDVRPDFTSSTAGRAISAAQFDIIAHELTHAYIKHGSKLNASTEAMAINEGIADIFGMVIRANFYNTSPSWSFGNGTGEYTRYFGNPHSDVLNGSSSPSAAYYGDPISTTQSIQYFNSGIMRHFFYLLTNGGTYNFVTVPAQGLNYTTNLCGWLAKYSLTPTSSYMYARNECLTTIAKWGGYCSPIYRAVANAWQAVGVGTNPCGVAPLTSAWMHGPNVGTTLRIGRKMVQFNVLVNGPKTVVSYSWHVPATWTVEYANGNSEMIIDNVSDYSSQQIYCVVTYTDGSKDTAYGVLHIVDCQTGDCGTDTSSKHPFDNNNQIVALDNGIKVFPIPASKVLNIMLTNEPSNTYLRIYNVLGQEVLKRRVNNKINSFALPPLSSGTYFLTINGDGLNSKKTIVINQ